MRQARISWKILPLVVKDFSSWLFMSVFSSEVFPAAGVETSSAKSRHIVLFDDECPLCTFQMKVLTWLDWFGALSLIPLSHEAAARLAPHLSREDLQEAIHCIAKDGHIHRGARCIRFVGMRLPMLMPVALFLWIPGVIQVAEICYQWVSRNRLLFSRIFGCKGACAILPARPRAQDDFTSR